MRRLPDLRLHTRTFIRDGKEAFLGSQSLRDLELDSRREIGVIFQDHDVIQKLLKIFEEDWKNGVVATEDEADDISKPPIAKVAKKVAKTVTKTLPPITPVLRAAVKDALPSNNGVSIDQDEIEETVRMAVKQAVKHAVREVVEDAVEQQREPEP
jgi:histone H3/H4